jgi:hypothetical protein
MATDFRKVLLAEVVILTNAIAVIVKRDDIRACSPTINRFAIGRRWMINPLAHVLWKIHAVTSSLST